MDKQKNKWFQSTGWIIALLFLFYPAGLFLAWKYATWKAWVKIAISVFSIFWLFGMIGIFSPSSQSSPQPSNTNTSASTQKAVVKPTSKPLTLQDKLWKVTDSLQMQRDATKINYDPQTGEVMVKFNIAKHWSDTHMQDLTPIALMNTEVNNFVSLGLGMFKIPEVKIVGIDFQTMFNDQYGNSTLQDAWKFSMTKDEFQKYDWQNMEGKPVFDQFVGNSVREDDYYIADSLQIAINEAGHDQVKLGKITW